MRKGKFITFEGCEGSGKSTQLSMFKEYLEKNGIDYIFLREPGGTEISEKIRSLILDVNNDKMTDECEALLYASARAQLVKEKILPALSEGKLVFCDRFIDSSFAYQAYARGLGMDFITSINSYAVNNCMPDCTIFLNISPDEAFKRKGGADEGDRLEQVGIEFHRKVFLGYTDLAKNNPLRFEKIYCLGSREQTHLNIINALKKRGVL
ncbi:MAG: dTMP kinase [Clostridia bacterium]|nr:dTMP kinase [Clostridia bacterium]